MNLFYQFILAVLLITANATPCISQTTSPVSQNDSIKTIVVKVKGITCSSDLKMIEANVEKTAGVVSCKAIKQSATSKFEVQYNPAKVSEAEIHSAIENTGSCEDPDERPYKVKQ